MRKYLVALVIAGFLAAASYSMATHVINTNVPTTHIGNQNSGVIVTPAGGPKVAAHLDALYGTPCGTRLFANCPNGDYSVPFRVVDVRAWQSMVWSSGSWSTAAYYECSWQAAGFIYSTVYSDCYGLLTWLESYAGPLMNLAAAWNVGIDFQWNWANQYVGWFTF